MAVCRRWLYSPGVRISVGRAMNRDEIPNEARPERATLP
jgi:hypothetical protein